MATWKEKEAAIRELEKSGRVDPFELIEVSRDPAHPCHGDFTWDIKKAAAERWHEQAKSLIRRCEFVVLVDEVSTPVVSYVSSPDGDRTFESLSRMRGASKVSTAFFAELSMLHGSSARVYGIALAKRNIVGVEVVEQLRLIRDQLGEMKSVLV